MKTMRLKRFLMVLPILALFSAPSWANSFSAYGSYWDTDDADASWGGGARVGFTLTKMLELEFHGTYYPQFRNDEFSGEQIDVTAIPVDAGLKLDFLPDKNVNPFIGAGISYYFLSTHPGSVDDETGLYADAGLDFGSAAKDSVRFFTEIMWRKVDASISFDTFDNDVKLDGFSLSAGATWRWGK
jgi:outer membrane protein W